MRANPSAPAIESLRQRERALTDLIEQVDGKLARLHRARTERAQALQRIRATLGLALAGGSVGSDLHEQR